MKPGRITLAIAGAAAVSMSARAAAGALRSVQLRCDELADWGDALWSRLEDDLEDAQRGRRRYDHSESCSWR